MRRCYLYTAVSLSGGAILAIEILGTRLLAPFYGTSLFLWSALITVTLAALGVGYAVGGRWADRGATVTRLSITMILAGLWTLVIPAIRTPLLELTSPLGLRGAVLIAALGLFFPPLMLLGMISPYAVKLRTESLERVGRSAGYLYSVSTFAGVFTALLMGFYLIPTVGVTRLAVIIGTILVAGGSVGILLAHRTARASAGIFLSIVVAVMALMLHDADGALPDRGILSLTHSPYAEVRVVEYRGARYLLIDGSVHSALEPGTWESLCPYVNVVDIARGFFQTPGSFLLIGLGAGSVAKHYTYAGWSVESVEIDPAVIEAAQLFCGLYPTDTTVIQSDGRTFLRSCDRSYDVIMFDAFGSSAIPFHLITEEVFDLAASRLSQDGLVVLNVEAHGWHDRIVRSAAATLRRCFAHVIALPIAEPPNQLGNVVLLAANRALELQEEPPTPEWRFSPEYDRAHAWDNRFVPDTLDVSIFTDDLNPIDLWSEEINHQVRKDLHQFFPDHRVGW
jgi:predicted membrane-bound spermidine synthase